MVVRKSSLRPIRQYLVRHYLTNTSVPQGNAVSEILIYKNLHKSPYLSSNSSDPREQDILVQGATSAYERPLERPPSSCSSDPGEQDMGIEGETSAFQRPKECPASWSSLEDNRT
ncbi:hypothetical protein HZH68_003998 [Vespula germanica]|uniref:Uncharacterized protein n=1 Tax=Vespula germanica TaxID=30212 RepID=A0A834KPD3_VESGE|nr:hypothetical protein HZH68_003998 [Vespula germanica]